MTPEEVMTKYEKYINPAATRLFRFMGLSSVEGSGEGWTVTDTEGNRFIDCLGGYGMFAARRPRHRLARGGGEAASQYAHERQGPVQ